MNILYKRYLFGMLFIAMLLAANPLLATTQIIMVGGPGGMSFVPSTGVTIELGDTIKWEWDNGSHTTTSTTIPAGATAWDEPINSGSTTFIYVPSVAGTYNYKCTPHQAMGMVGSFTVICNPPAAPVVSPSGPITSCSGDSASLLTVSAAAGITLQWNLNGNAIAGATNEQFLPQASGTYTCMGTNSCGTALSNSVMVTLIPGPAPSFTFTHTGLDYSFTNTTTDLGLSWSWDFGDGTSSEEQDPHHLYTSEGTYMVTLTATDTAGTNCSGEAVQQITTDGTGIGAISAGSNDYLISPNPANGFIQVIFKEGNPSFEIYDISGRLIGNPQITSRSDSEVRLDIRNLSPGNYLLKIKTKTGFVTRKFTVNR